MSYVKNGVNVGLYVTKGVNAHNYVEAPETTWQDQVVVEGAHWYQPQYIRQPPAGVHTPSGSKAALAGCGVCGGGWGQAPDMSALMAAAVPGGADTPPAGTGSLVVPLLLAGGALLIFLGTIRKRG